MKKAGGNGATHAVLQEMTMKLGPAERASLSEAASSALLIEERGAHWRGEASPLYDHAVFFNADGMADWAWDDDGTTEETMEAYRALIDAMFQNEDRGSRGGSPNLRHHPNGIDAGSNSKKRRGPGGEKGKAVLESRNEADARRAWEATKRRVIHLEEFGELPDDVEAERASRERRAWRRKGWAEETIQGKAREDASLGADKKKRRRQGGCWMRENGVFVRLQVSANPRGSFHSFSCRNRPSLSFIMDSPAFLFFTVCAAKMSPLGQVLGEQVIECSI